MGQTHNGVLIPAEMESVTTVEKARYAEEVKAGNRAFLDLYWLLMDTAERQGILTCPGCGQEQLADGPCVCREEKPEKRHEVVRLFTPTAEPIPGQMTLGGGSDE